jgi:hypothetical protein
MNRAFESSAGSCTRERLPTIAPQGDASIQAGFTRGPIKDQMCDGFGSVSENQYPERDSCVNSATRSRARVREFWPKSHPIGGYLPHPERDGCETECPSGKPANLDSVRRWWRPGCSCWSGICRDAVTHSREQAHCMSSMPSPYFSAASSRSQRSSS